LLESEIFEAINFVMNNKAGGIDGVQAEFLKHLGPKGRGGFVIMCN